MATPGEYTETLGNLIAFGYDTDAELHLSADYYPIYDESHRAELNKKIVRHYALREIGQETAQQFVFYLGMTMAEIMPYFNERYRTLALRYDPLNTMEMVSESLSNTVAQSSGKPAPLRIVRPEAPRTAPAQVAPSPSPTTRKCPQPACKVILLDTRLMPIRRKRIRTAVAIARRIPLLSPIVHPARNGNTTLRMGAPNPTRRAAPSPP